MVCTFFFSLSLRLRWEMRKLRPQAPCSREKAGREGNGQPACQSTEALRSIQAEWLQRPSSPFDTTEVMTPILILMVQSRPEAHSPIQSLCVKHTPLNKQRRERLLERKSLLGCLSHFGHLPIPLPQDRTGFLLSTMSYLGSSLGRKTKSDVYPQAELIETYPYSHPVKGLMIRDFTLPDSKS